MKKYFGWIFVFMASLTVVSAFADDTVSNDQSDQVAYGDVSSEEGDMEEIEE